MVAASSIFLWEGKIQLGDEPGIYGNASFSGLAVKFPITLNNTDPTTSKDDVVTLGISTGDVNVYGGYPGHKITVFGYKEDSANPYHWLESVLATGRITGGTSISIDVPVEQFPKAAYIALLIEIDITVTPGFYDDFIVSGLTYKTQQSAVYAKFGFQ